MCVIVLAVKTIVFKEFVLYPGNVSQSESLFTYIQGLAWQSYSHPNHIPVFADEIVPTDAQKNICGNDTQCIYDLFVTNSTAFAMATNQFNVNNNIAVKLISELSIVSSYMVANPDEDTDRGCYRVNMINYGILQIE